MKLPPGMHCSLEFRFGPLHGSLPSPGAAQSYRRPRRFPTFNRRDLDGIHRRENSFSPSPLRAFRAREQRNERETLLRARAWLGTPAPASPRRYFRGGGGEESLASTGLTFSRSGFEKQQTLQRRVCYLYARSHRSRASCRVIFPTLGARGNSPCE